MRAFQSKYRIYLPNLLSSCFCPNLLSILEPLHNKSSTPPKPGAARRRPAGSCLHPPHQRSRTRAKT